MDLTGAQIKTVLEQQWQRDAGGNVPTRPFLRLGVSEGFTYTYRPADPAPRRRRYGGITGHVAERRADRARPRRTR